MTTMSWLKQRKAGRILLGIFVGFGLLAFIAWQMLRPKIGHASLDEIEAVLPPELRGEPKVDEAAVARMAQVIDISHHTRSGAFADISNTRSGASQRLKLERLLLERNKDRYDQLRTLLDEGPLQFSRAKGFVPTISVFSDQMDLVRNLSMAGADLTKVGDYSNGGSALKLAVRLTRAISLAGGDLVRYAESALIAAANEASILEVARLENYPAEDRKDLLNQLSPTTSGDPCLASAIREEFRSTVLPLLQNPDKLVSRIAFEYRVGDLATPPSAADGASQKSPPLFGTFEPIDTARIGSKICLVLIRNAERPLSAYDDGCDRLKEAQSRGLPKPADYSNLSSSFEDAAFRLAMNNSKNSLGRALISFSFAGGGRQMIVASCTNRTKHELTRVFLASQLYRHDHGGSLPKRLDELVPRYLATIPLDPFNGKPMLYNRSTQAAYSVGPSLVDDGGDFSTRSGSRRDIGISLASSEELKRLTHPD